MAIYYLSAVDYIKNRPFRVWAPAYYLPHVPEHIKNPNAEPLPKVNRFKMVPTRRPSMEVTRSLQDPDQMQECNYTIEVLIDMHRRNVTFELQDENDIVEIFDALDRYLLSLKQDVEFGEETVVEYARRVIAFRQETYKHYFRYMKLNPTALEKLYPNNDPQNNLLHLLSTVNSANHDYANLDPLKAKSFPPYDIDKILPKDNAGNPVHELESSLGLSNNMADALSMSDFNFDDFLKKV